MKSRLSTSKRVLIRTRQHFTLRNVAIGASAATVLSAAAIFAYRADRTESAAAKKSKDGSGYEYTICPGENVQLDSFDGDYYRWTPAIGLDNSAVKHPVASPKKTTAYTATVYTRLDTLVSLTDTLVARDGWLLRRDFATSAYDSYDLVLRARSKSPDEKLQLQLCVNDIPVLRYTAESEIRFPASVIWDNIDENEATVTLKAISPERYNDTVYIDGLYVVLLDKQVLLTQVYVDKNCKITASR